MSQSFKYVYLVIWTFLPCVEASCSGTFLKFGGTCLYLAKDVKKTWDAARTFCQDLGGDLAVFRDANALAEAIGYARAVGESFSSTVHVLLFIHVLINTFFISFEDDNGCYVMVMSQTTIIVPRITTSTTNSFIITLVNDRSMHCIHTRALTILYIDKLVTQH